MMKPRADHTHPSQFLKMVALLDAIYDFDNTAIIIFSENSSLLRKLGIHKVTFDEEQKCINFYQILELVLYCMQIISSIECGYVKQIQIRKKPVDTQVLEIRRT